MARVKMTVAESRAAVRGRFLVLTESPGTAAYNLGLSMGVVLTRLKEIGEEERYEVVKSKRGRIVLYHIKDLETGEGANE